MKFFFGVVLFASSFVLSPLSSGAASDRGLICQGSIRLDDENPYAQKTAVSKQNISIEIAPEQKIAQIRGDHELIPNLKIAANGQKLEIDLKRIDHPVAGGIYEGILNQFPGYGTLSHRWNVAPAAMYGQFSSDYKTLIITAEFESKNPNAVLNCLEK